MSEKRPVIVTTSYRGVFYGYAEGPTTSEQVTLTEARNVQYWGTTQGLWELSATGPTSKTKLSAVAPRIELRSITAVCDVSPEAEAVWQRQK